MYTSIDLALDELAHLIVYSWQYRNVLLRPWFVRYCRYVDRGEEILAEISALLVGPCKCTVL